MLKTLQKELRRKCVKMKEFEFTMPYSEELINSLNNEMDELGQIYLGANQDVRMEVLPIEKKNFINEVHPVVSIVINLTSEIAIGLLVNWLYDKLKGSGKIVIGGKKVDIDSEELKEILSDYIDEKQQ